MLREMVNIANDSGRSFKQRLIGIYLILFVLNIGAWGYVLIAFRHHPVLLGTALLAYGFGLRHAVDADHIAAIDNVTRKMMQQNKKPVAVGFFFSVGHSLVVILASALIAITTAEIAKNFDWMKEAGGIIGTTVSASFLFLIAIMNLVIFSSIYKSWVNVKNGGIYKDDDFDMLLTSRGFLARIFRPAFRLVSQSWHMLPLGFLFGLGFDTASEVGLLGISASQANQGFPIWSIMVFPMLFVAGMSLVDTLDGHLMLGAYGWARMQPIRKIYYNLSITFVSSLVAIVIGAIETLGLLSDQFGLSGGIWDTINSLNDNFGTLGYIIIAVFIASWLISMLVYKYKDYEKIEIRHE
ncbi:HoxN/HupN/NixA family nickel/cobalt transporter [Laribacter hongkongensis]|uniref:HoxN/HupN/NixA family nickel/cobalt transporter n=1 Tax=Laribacter hongkongensis TaxID=168471 RepID=UPI0004852D3D|nr:HoxN/HupN/NixA family nickel/cobalt transporter [Laribacter hongkongensis]